MTEQKNIHFASATETSKSSQTSLAITIMLWILQALLADLFLFGGVFKLIGPMAEVAQATHMPVLFLRFIGACETLGGLGLILPGLLRIKQGLTPLAAIGLAIITVGATVVTIV